MSGDKRILVALPDKTFFEEPELEPIYQRLERLGEVRRTWQQGEQELPEHFTWAQASLSWWWPVVNDRVLDAAPEMEFLGRIDIDQSGARAALARGLAVSCTRGGFSPAVAEMALTLILTTLRRVSDFHARMRTGEESWVQRFPGDIDSTERELTGRSVGIIGFGGIGRRLAQLLSPFNCDLRVVDPYVGEDAAAGLGGRLVDMAELVSASDVVVLAASCNPGTRHLLGAAEIEAMPRNAVLVNVARSALVDMGALVKRLRRGDLFAALDVFDVEPLAADDELRSLPTAHLTPHRAGGIAASAERILTWLVDDLEAHFQGRPLKHAVDEGMVSSLDG